MVRPLPALSGAALVPRGRRGQSDEPAVSTLPQDRDGVARDVLDAGPFAAQLGTEEAARRLEIFWPAVAPSRSFRYQRRRGPAAPSGPGSSGSAFRVAGRRPRAEEVQGSRRFDGPGDRGLRSGCLRSRRERLLRGSPCPAPGPSLGDLLPTAVLR